MGSPALISLCMIVRDEEQLLGRCLESVHGVADELCVLDTGSRDTTVQVAREHGARVEETRWGDSFAAARNASLELARGDWILFLDADETLLGPDARERLLAFAREHPPLPGNAGHAGQLRIENLNGAGQSSQALGVRYFPRSADWRFEGRIHEQLMFRGAVPPSAPTGLVIEHVGYAPERMASRGKLARNETLLRAVLASNPLDAYAAYQLGLTLALGERHAEAGASFEDSIEFGSDQVPYLAHLFEAAAASLRALGQSQDALDGLSQIEHLFPNRADTCFLLALLAMDTGALARAHAGFTHCLTLEGSSPAGGESSPSASTFAAACNLGVMAEVLGQTADARGHYQRALQSYPEHPASLAGLVRLGEE